jgi:hypothetical protein
MRKGDSMKTLNWVVTAIGILGLTGCGSALWDGGNVPNVPTNAPVSQIQAGAGTSIAVGVQAGYGITANTGGAYRLVWTGDAAASGSYRSFQGSIYTAGSIQSVSPNVAAGDYVGQPLAVGGGMRLDFDTIAATDLDGIDFNVTSEPVYFNLVIDGTAQPALVQFPDATTQMQATAPGMPFGLTTQ